MSEGNRVKFRTGRDPNDSEARSSAGIPQYYKNASNYYQPRHWDVDSLHQKIGFLTRGLKKSDNDFQIYDLLADADHILDVIMSYYSRSAVICEDTERLHAVLDERHSRLMQGSTYETRLWLKDLSRRLERAAGKHAQANPAKITQHDSP